MLIRDILFSNAGLFPEKPALIDPHTRCTWRQFNRRVNRLAAGMQRLGLGRGDRAAIISENRLEYAEFLYAAASAGVIGVLPNHRLRPEKIHATLSAAGIRAVFIEDKYLDLVSGFRLEGAEVPVITIGDNGNYRDLVHGDADDFTAPALTGADPFLLVFSTGTTGEPKGILLSNHSWITCARHRLWVNRFTADDVYLVGTPLFATGSLGHFFGAGYAGLTVVTGSFSGEFFASMVSRERVSATYFSPPTYRIAREYLESNPGRYDLSSLRRISIAGGQAFDGAGIRDMLDYFGVAAAASSKTYGMSELATDGTWLLPSEMASALSPDAPPEVRRRLDSVGRPVGSTAVRIVDADGLDLPPGTPGEIVVRSEALMLEYWRQPEMTAHAVSDGRYRTGDRGEVDAAGYLYFHGRLDNLIKSGGFFVAAEEVEKVLLGHPAVRDAGVFGEPHPKWGQMVKAVVCLRPDAQVAAEDIIRYCRGRLASFQVPKAVVFTASLPRDATRSKIARRELATRHTARQGGTENEVP